MAGRMQGLLDANHANYMAAKRFRQIAAVLIVALIALSEGLQATLTSVDFLVGWLSARVWTWPLIAFFWVGFALNVRDWWRARR